MNMRGLGRAAVVLVVLAALFASRTAAAQDKKALEGAGYPTGDFILHPAIGIGFGYDSNYLLRTNRAGASNGCPVFCPEQSAGMNISPSISINTSPTKAGDPRRSYSFTGSLSSAYHEDFGTLSPEQRNVGVASDASLELFPGNVVGGRFFGTYLRTIQPSVFGNPDLAYNRDDIGVGTEFVLVPGQGTLDWHLGYQFHDTIFEQSAGSPYDNIAHIVSTRGRWKFRPRTALMYDASASFASYVNVNASAGAIAQLHNSTPIRTRIGLSGLITERLSLTGMVGWGASFFVPGVDPNVQQYDSVIGTAQLSYALGHSLSNDDPFTIRRESLSSITLGYNRDFSNSYVSDYYGSDRGFLRFSFFFGARALLWIEGGAGAIEYPELHLIPALITAGGADHAAFTDLRVDGTLFAEYRFLESVGVNATFRYTSNISNEVINLGNTNGTYAMQWQRIEAYLGVRWFL
jgi:hypothetical protein